MNCPYHLLLSLAAFYCLLLTSASVLLHFVPSAFMPLCLLSPSPPPGDSGGFPLSALVPQCIVSSFHHMNAAEPS